MLYYELCMLASGRQPGKPVKVRGFESDQGKWLMNSMLTNIVEVISVIRNNFYFTQFRMQSM